MSSQPPYGSYPAQSQPWPEQPPDPSYPGYAQPGAYPPPPSSYGAAPYPPPPGQQPAAPVYGAPNVYMQPVPYPYVVAAPPDPGAGQAVTSLVLGIIGAVFAVMSIIPCFFGFIATVTGIIGLIMGILGRKSTSRRSMATTGIVLSSISIGLSVIFTALWILLNVAAYSLPSNP